MPPIATTPSSFSPRPFRRAVLSGLGVVLPPLLTIVILVWIWNTVQYYVLEPVTYGAQNVLSWALADVRTEIPGSRVDPDDTSVVVTAAGEQFKRLDRGEFVPLDVYNAVFTVDGPALVPSHGKQLYRRYVQIEYLRPQFVVPVFLLLFVLLMYLLGNLFAAGLGQAFWGFFEQGVGRLPLVRGVYSAVKQVTDFMLTQHELEFTRVVAVEYPSKGVWSLAFVTGEGLPAVTAAAGEPLLSVLVATSPMPLTGYTMMILKSEVIDVDLTVDQAVQYLISCGVVLPSGELPPMLPALR